MGPVLAIAEGHAVADLECVKQAVFMLGSLSEVVIVLMLMLMMMMMERLYLLSSIFSVSKISVPYSTSFLRHNSFNYEVYDNPTSVLIVCAHSFLYCYTNYIRSTKCACA